MADEVREFLTAALSANDLRALAEATDSIRNEDACVVRNPDAGSTGRRFIVVPKSAAGNRTQILTLRTNDRNDQDKPVQREPVTLTADKPLEFVNGRVININQCDAIFTSLSAVEKFVVPYYARMRGLVECESMRGQFASDARAVAMLHLPGSVEETARLADTANMFVAGAKSTDTGPRLTMLSVQEFLKK